MKFSQVDDVVRSIPYTGSRKGKFLYDFVRKHSIRDIIELGFAHGTSTCYMAAALKENGGGRIDTVDLEQSALDPPRVEELSKQLGLCSLINVHREVSSYTWFLKEMIERKSAGGACEPIYDMCFIDGPKDWTNDGAAFFMVDKLLKPGAWVVFDDYSWSYRRQEELFGASYNRGYVFESMSEQEFAEPHVAAIFNLLVRQHPAYSNFQVIDGDLACAQKTAPTRGPNTVVYRSSLTLSYIGFSLLKKIRWKIRQLTRRR